MLLESNILLDDKANPNGDNTNANPIGGDKNHKLSYVVFP